MNKNLEDKEIPLGEKIRALRLAKKMTQQEVAEGVSSASAVSQIENGIIINPTFIVLEGIAKNLGVTVGDLISLDKVPADIQLEKLKLFVDRRDYTTALSFIDDLRISTTLEYPYKRVITFLQARSFIGTGQNKEAIDLLKEFEKEINVFSTSEEKDFTLAELYNLIGNAYFPSDMENAFNSYLQASEYHLFERDLLKGHIDYNLGRVHSFLGNDSQAMAYYASAQRIYSGIEAVDTQLLGDTYYAMGNACFNAGHHQRAGNYFRLAQTIYDSAKHVRMSLRVRAAYADRVLAKENQTEADKLFAEVSADLIKVGDRHSALLAFANHANLLLDMEETERAHKRLRAVYDKFTDLLDTVDPRVAVFHRVFARYYLSVESYDLCIRYAYNSSEMFSIIGLLRESASSLELAMDALQKKGDITKAFEVSKKIIGLFNQAEEGFK